MTNRTAYFIVASEEPCYELGSKLVDVIKNLQVYLDTVPEQYHNLVEIYFDYDYDGIMHFDIGYLRKKTDEEIQAEEQHALKLKQEQEKAKKDQAVKDAAAEKALYKRLQKKYG